MALQGENFILFVIGTRPEAIKLAPVIKVMGKRGLSTRILLTGQHVDLVNK
jgi:UDP-N-acetylglucosamine 2-epimerase